MYNGKTLVSPADGVSALDYSSSSVATRETFSSSQIRRLGACPIDLQAHTPGFIHTSDGKWRDINVLDILLIEPGAFYHGPGPCRF